MRKASIVAGSVAIAAIGSTALGGVALAGSNCCEHKPRPCCSRGVSHHDNDYARGGDGGNATNNCLNVGVGILSGIGAGGSGTANPATCNASANGGNATAY